MSAASSLSDSVILKETRFSDPDAKGRRQMQFTLPSGRVITSTDWLVPAEVKGKVLIAWANAIRAEDAFDLQEREERERLARVEKRARELSSAAGQGSTAPAGPQLPNKGSSGSAVPAETSKASSTPALPDDPRELVKSKLDTLSSTFESLTRQLESILDQRKAVEENISRWRAIASSLGVDWKEPEFQPIKPSDSSEETSTASSSTASSPLPPKKRRSKHPYRRDMKSTVDTEDFGQ